VNLLKGNEMKQIIGAVLMVIGIAVGIYAGFWWAFVGGIVDIVDAVKAENIVAMDIAIGIAKIVFAGAIGTITAFVSIIPGYALFQSK
jgi:hypothetical protein